MTNLSGDGYESTSEGWLKIIKSVYSPLISQSYVGRNLDRFYECINFNGTFYNPFMRYINPPGRHLNLPFALAETLDVLLDKNPGISYKYNSKMKKFININTGKYDGHYGDRIYGFNYLKGKYYFNQLERVLEELQNENNSRRAVIIIHNPAMENWYGVDIACTISLQFLLRDGKLHLITNMRSEDIYLGFCYDTFEFQFIQEMLASMLGAELGNYYHNVGSLHLYVNDVVKLSNIQNDAIYKKYSPVPMKLQGYDLAQVLTQLKALHTMASECIEGKMEQSRELFDCIFDKYLRNCAYVFQAEGHRRFGKHNGLGMVEWENMFTNEYLDYFQSKSVVKNANT